MVRRPFIISISLTLALAAAAPLHAGGGRNRVAGSPITLQPVRDAMVVDGELGEWDESDAVFLSVGHSGAAGDGRGAFDNGNARIALRHAPDALYVGVWWNDPTPLGAELSPGVVPAGDGLVLHMPVAGTMHHLALWRVPHAGAPRALHSVGQTSLAQGSPAPDVQQGFRQTGDTTYTQEARIPWSVFGGRPPEAVALRLGVELCFGGLDMTAGYRAWTEETAGQGATGNRWGGNLGWGFVDGIRDESVLNPRFDPANGARVELKPAGSVAPPNAPVLFMGDECTRTTRMIAVPAGRITLDGMLSEGEWEPASATRIASEPSLLPGRYETDVHWAFDAAGLYVGLRWHTGGPHLNINDPARIGRGYDGGDALQLRLGTDRVTQIDTWFFTAGWQAAMRMEYGVRFDEGSVADALAEGARMAIEPLGGGGYSQEIFLPWSMITKTGVPLKEGDSFRAILDLFYSGLEKNRLPFILNASLAASTGVVDVPFVAPRDGFYTVTIDNADGTAIRRLIVHRKLVQGQRVADWDGLDDAGKPAAPGAYRFRGLHHTGLGLTYLMTYNNPGHPPWQIYDGAGEWGGDHCAPQAVAADDWGVYLGWAAAEDGDGIIGCDVEGQKQWGFFQTPYPAGAGAATLASDGKFLYFGSDFLNHKTIKRRKEGPEPLASFESYVSCLDRETGRRRGFSLSKPYDIVAGHDTAESGVYWWWDLWAERNLSLDTGGIRDDYFFTGRSSGANLTGLAAGGGRLYASLRIPQQIAVFDSDTLAEVARWNVPKPAGLALAVDGALLAVSDTSVVRVNTTDGTFTPVVAGGLDAPVDLALDAGGDLYVSQWGAAHCVAVFAPDGTRRRTIGNEGGRHWIGAYDPNGMLMPRGIAIDPKGKLWVCENDNHPRRISVWEAASGKFLREFIGGTTYGAVNGGILDPRHPTRALSHGVLFEIDFPTAAYRPLATVSRRFDGDRLFDPTGGWIHNAGYVECEGRRFFYSGPGGHIVIGQVREDGAWLPRVAIGGIFNRGDNPMVVSPEKRLWRHSFYPDFVREKAGHNFVWTDLNADGRCQEGEFQWEKQSPDFPCLGIHWGSGRLNDNLDIVTGVSHENAVFRFPRQGWTEDGMPLYELSTRQRLCQPEGRIMALTTDREGRVITTQQGEWERPDFKPHVTGYNADGTVRWRYPTSKDVRPMGNINGEGFLGPVDSGGEAGEIWSLTQWHGGHLPIVTTDGLFIGRVLRDPSADPEPGPDVYRGETVQYLNRLDDGRLIFSHGKNAHHLLELTGLATVRRFAGDVELSAEHSRLAAARLAERERLVEAQAPIRIARLAAPPVTDGNLEDWDMTAAASIGAPAGTPRARVALGYDDQCLYLAWDVVKNGPYLNVSEDPNQLFLGGDAVDLQFCTDPAADPRRREPVIGDSRLLIARFDGQPVAVLYRAKVPGAESPVAFRSPTRAVAFDEVRVIDGAQIAIVDSDSGYRVEAALPVKALVPDFIWPGRVLQGDAGIIVADATGRRVARLYRFNQDTGVVNDIPTEATLGIPHWGEIETDRTDR